MTLAGVQKVTLLFVLFAGEAGQFKEAREGISLSVKLIWFCVT